MSPGDLLLLSVDSYFKKQSFQSNSCQVIREKGYGRFCHYFLSKSYMPICMCI